MKDYFTKKELMVILIVVLVIVTFISYKIIFYRFIQEPLKISQDLNMEDLTHEDLVSNLPNELDIDEGYEKEDEIIMVHISGQVHFPGIVQLQKGARVKDAVELAGGLKKEADLDKINLAKKLQDEDKIYIPKMGEEVDLPLEDYGNSSGSSGKININSCSKEELMSLPGIGEVTATRILEYRKSYKFKSIEDIMNVSGIGEKKFEAIKDLITVN